MPSPADHHLGDRRPRPSPGSLGGGRARLWPAALGLGLAGCAFGPGNPWGVAEVTLFAERRLPPERSTAEGRLRTSSSYAVALERVEAELGPLTLSVRGPGGATSFDPARPPPGYTLCHHGHCHADDGRLVDYEEIEASLGGGPVRTERLIAVESATVAVESTRTEVPIGPCPEECTLERGRLDRVRLALSRLVIAGRAFDLRAAPALPAEGVAFRARLAPEAALEARLDEPVDDGEPLGVRLRVAFVPTATLFDGIDFGALLGGDRGVEVDLGGHPDFTPRVLDNLTENESLTVEVERFD